MVNASVYNPKDCVIIVGGVYITGLGEDMVSCEKDEENFSTSVGAQGDVVINQSNNQLGTITITAQGTCPQRPYLMGLAKAGTLFDVWVINKSIGAKIGGTKAMMKKPPAFEQGMELAEQEYEIQVFDYTVDQ